MLEAVDMSLGENVPIERVDVAKVNPATEMEVQALSGEDPKYGTGQGVCSSWGQRDDKIQMKSAFVFSMGSLGPRPERHPATREVFVLASASPQTNAEVGCVIAKNPLRVFQG